MAGDVSPVAMFFYNDISPLENMLLEFLRTLAKISPLKGDIFGYRYRDRTMDNI